MKRFSQIAAVGVELEGGWNRNPYNIVDAHVHTDGSIDLECLGAGGSSSRCDGCADEDCSGPGGCGCDCHPPAGTESAQWVNEVVSVPLDTPTRVLTWIKEAYPDVMNKSCGLHVHVSLKRKEAYQNLMDKRFYRYVLKGLRAWGKAWGCKSKEFWHRLDGKNTYCKREYCPDTQIQYEDKGGPRYTVLNYCYGVHETIELRVLPCFQEAATAQAAVMAYLNLVEKFLKMLKKHEAQAVFDFASGEIIAAQEAFTVEAPEEIVLSFNPAEELAYVGAPEEVVACV